MKRNNLITTIAGVVIATMVGGMALVGCTSDGEDAGASPTKSVSVSGWAYADGPLQNATLSVSTDGKTVVRSRHKATNRAGTFSQNAAVPADYRVTVGGGTVGDEVFTGQLVADVVDRGPSSGLIQVNALTTLLAAYRDRHPNLSPEMAQAAVRRYLQLPDGVDLTADIRGLEHLFSAAAFQRQAETAGGMQRFVKRLVAEIDARPARTRSFAGAPQNDLTTDLLKTAAKAAAKYGITKVLGQFGLEPPDQVVSDALKQISGQITALQVSINNLETLIKSDAFQNAAKPAYVLANKISSAYAWMVFGAQHDSAEGRTRTADAMKMAADLSTDTAQKNMNTYLMGTGSGGAYRALSAYLLADGTFWTPAKSTTLLQFFDYFDSIQSQLVMVLAERDHAEGVGDDALERQDPDPSLKGALTWYNENHAAELAIRPAAAPTVIDKRTNLMWPVSIGNRPDTQWYGQLSELSTLNHCTAVLVGLQIRCTAPSLYGFDNWRLPESSELKDLLAGQPNPKAWLRLPENWGPTAFVRAKPLTDVVNIWSGTHDPDPRNEWHYLTNLDTGKATSRPDSTLATIWPVRGLVAGEKYWL